MNKLLYTFLALLATSPILGQASGNINYQMRTRYLSNNIELADPLNEDVYVTVKGMANVKADVFVAIFSVSQVGNTTQEVNKLINERINSAVTQLKAKAAVEAFVDMVSFVPVYEYEVEKKIFSKKT